MVHGVWVRVCGTWCEGKGMWYMVYGVRVCGTWCEGKGMWYMV